MRTHLDIIEDLYYGLRDNGFDYEFKSLKNEVSHHYTTTELIGEVSSVLLKMKEKESVNKAVGKLIDEFAEYAKRNGINSKPSKFYSIVQKEFVLDGSRFSDLKGFYNEIGALLTENNDWKKNWDAFNDILIGGFIKTEYGEPFKLVWKNSRKSEEELEDFQDILDLVKEHEHIELKIE